VGCVWVGEVKDRQMINTMQSVSILSILLAAILFTASSYNTMELLSAPSEQRVLDITQNRQTIGCNDNCLLVEEARPTIFTTHKQTQDQLEIIVGISAANFQIPSKIEIVLDSVPLNATQISDNHWHVVAPLPTGGCAKYHVLVWTRTWFRYPDNHELQTHGIGTCMSTEERGICFSLLLYILLIGCCLYI